MKTVVLLIGQIVGQILLFLCQRFLFNKNRNAYIILSVCSWLGLIIWAVYRGLQDLFYVDLWSVLAACVLPYGLYVLSLWIVGTPFSKENLIPVACFRLSGKLKIYFESESLRNPYGSLYEELLYRWFLQNALFMLTHSAVISVTVTFLAFFAVHLDKKIAIVQMIDIFVFSLVITLFYHWSGSLLCCAWIHFARNQLIINQKYVLAKAELEKKTKYMRILKERAAKQEESADKA